jgi:hypothetical protein
MSNNPDSDLDTPIWGAGPSGVEIGLDRHQTYYALARGLVPATKVGRKYVSTRRRLRACIGGQQPNQQST